MPALRLTAEETREVLRQLEAVKLRGVPGQSVAAERFLAALEKRRAAAASPAAPDQPALWELDATGAPIPWRGRLGGGVPVRCDRHSTPDEPCILPLSTCIQRQDALWPGKKAHRYEFCATCPQGAEYKRRSAYSAAEDWAARSKNGRPTYQPFRKDSGIQRRKMREHDARAAAEWVPTMDEPPIPEAEHEESTMDTRPMTPDPAAALEALERQRPAPTDRRTRRPQVFAKPQVAARPENETRAERAKLEQRRAKAKAGRKARKAQRRRSR